MNGFTLYNPRENERRNLMFSASEDNKKVGLETNAESSSNTFMSTQKHEGRLKVLRRIISPPKK